jgi:hypothetical protein
MGRSREQARGRAAAVSPETGLVAAEGRAARGAAPAVMDHVGAVGRAPAVAGKVVAVAGSHAVTVPAVVRAAVAVAVRIPAPPSRPDLRVPA